MVKSPPGFLMAMEIKEEPKMNTKRVLSLILLIIPFILTSQKKENIEIKTNVEDAFIYLDDKRPIRTDKNCIAVIPDVPHGKHKIKIEKGGYKNFSGTITVNQENTLFNLDLEKKVILQISCNVPGAEILINNVSVGMTDSNGYKTIESIPGEVTLEIKHKYFFPICKKIYLKKGLNTPDYFTLEEIKTWELRLWCNELDATVFIDDKKHEQKTRKEGVSFKLPPGNHIIRIEKEDFQTKTKMVSIIKGLARNEATIKITSLGVLRIRALLIALIFFVLASASVIFITLLKASKKPRIIGKFELVKIIGIGGIATIYKAKDKMEKKIVAIKILNNALRNDADIVDKFYREGEILSQINENFPNAPVVKVFDYRDREKFLGIPYISMQLIKGDSLLNIIKGKKELTVEYKLYITREVVKGLIVAHKLKIIHGDITPDNIIINGKKVILIDFGIAVEGYNKIKNMDTSLMGKPVYMSPEQCSGIPIDEKSDVYSLGIILFLMFHGVPPFTAKNPAEILKMHRESPLPEMDSRIPNDIKEMIIHMLAKEPGNRPGTIELGEILDRLILKYKIT